MQFELPNIIFVILLAVTTGYLTFLTTKGGLTNLRYSALWDKLTKRGKLVLYVLLFMLITLVCQEYNNQVSIMNNAIVLANERRDRDSLITVGINSGVESSNARLFNNLSQAFADQNLKIDTLRNKVIELKDSANTTVNDYSQADPIFSIGLNGISLVSKKDTRFEYELALKSTDAGSTNYRVESYVLVEYDNETSSFHKVNFFKYVKIPKNGEWTGGFLLNSLNDVKKIFLYVVGTYTTLDGVKSYKVDDIYVYQDSNKMTHTVVYPERDVVINRINEYLNKP